MQRLRRADDVQHERRAHPLDTVEHTGEVARGVVEATVALADDERQRLALTVGVARWEDHLSTVALLEQAGFLEADEHARQERVVHAFGREVVVGEEHAELPVHLVEVLRALGDEDPPQLHRFGIVALQQDDTVAGADLELVVRIELRTSGAVEAVEIADLEIGRRAEIDKMLDQHAEGRAPVADVILLHDAMAEERHQPDECVADHRGAQMPDVHLLRHVRRRVVDDDGPRLRHRPDAEPVVRADGRQGGAEEGVGKGDVEKARTGDLDDAEIIERPRGGDHLGGHLTWRAAELLRQTEDAVRLRIGALGGPDDRVDIAGPGTGDGGERRSQSV